MIVQSMENKALAWAIVCKSACLLAAITIRTWQGANAASVQTCGEVGPRSDYGLQEQSDEAERWHSACIQGMAILTNGVSL